jgi:hypothetical protein
VSQKIHFLFFCWDSCQTVLYRLRKVVRRLNPILPKEASMAVSRKKFFVCSLGWLLNGDVTLVEGSAGASLLDAVQFDMEFFVLCTCGLRNLRCFWDAFVPTVEPVRCASYSLVLIFFCLFASPNFVSEMIRICERMS